MRKFAFLLYFLVFLAIGVFAQGKKYSEFYYQRASLFDLLPIDSTNIVFLGNSITNGAEWHELLGLPNVVNRGISGDIVGGIEDRLAPIVNGHPAKIFLMIGVNDVSHGVTADSIATAFLELVDHIQKVTPRTKLYVQSILPINMSFGRYKGLTDKEQVIRDINNVIQTGLEDRGVTWINLYPYFANDEGNLRVDLTNDGLHLLGSGYILWRDIVRPYVLE